MNMMQSIMNASTQTAPADSGRACKIPLADILPDERNFYTTGEIAALAASIMAFGQEQPLIVRPAPGNPGKYVLTSGHRRRLALLELQKAQPDKYSTANAVITSSMGDLADRARLILSNSTARDKNDFERMMEATELAEIAADAKKAGVQFPGKVRDAVAETLKISSGQVGKYQAIKRNLVPGLMEKYRTGQIGTQTAFELCGLPKRQQEEIANGPAAPTLDDARAAKAARKQAQTAPQAPAQKPAARMMEPTPEPVQAPIAAPAEPASPEPARMGAETAPRLSPAPADRAPAVVIADDLPGLVEITVENWRGLDDAQKLELQKMLLKFWEGACK